MMAVTAASILSVVIISAVSIIPSFIMLNYEMKEKLLLIKYVQYVSENFLKSVGAAGLYYGIKTLVQSAKMLNNTTENKVYLFSVFK